MNTSSKYFVIILVLVFSGIHLYHAYKYNELRTEMIEYVDNMGEYCKVLIEEYPISYWDPVYDYEKETYLRWALPWLIEETRLHRIQIDSIATKMMDWKYTKFLERRF